MDQKLEQAWAELQKLPPEEQDIAAEAILDYAARATRPQLSDEHVQEVERRLTDPTAKSISLRTARRRYSRKTS